MKLILMTSFLTWSFLSFAQNLSPEEQRQMLQELKELKARVNKLENKNSSGLKTTNYANETVETKTTPGSEAPVANQPSLTPEQTQELMKNIEAFKQKQKEAQKILDDLEKEE